MQTRLFLLFILMTWPFVTVAAPEKQCIDCHMQAVSSWQQSDHAKAMAKASKNTILGDFSGVEVTHFSQSVRFYQRDENFYIRFTEGEKTNEYLVSYTFGHYPLQQYLIATKGGRFQVFPFAWDSRTKEQGGQRWYPMYPEEDVKPADRLHWQQPLQNWNGMCADCHSDGLKRNYSVAENQFDTRWDNINVGCQSCHGNLSASHYQNKKSNPVKFSSAEKEEFGQWLLKQGETVARWQGPERDNSFMQDCFACHSLRAPLNDGILPGRAFLDQFSPTLISQPLYHADGQIKDEVYVYGSFLQSKMYAAGVNCLDCHTLHTMKVKTQNNGLCLQCHSSEKYQVASHLNHAPETEAARCVTCHMPETTYMGVDSRRDHSFKIPRPDLSEQFDTPNVCTNCHQDQNNRWASDTIKSLYGNNNQLSETEQNYIRLQHQYFLPEKQHLAIINDESLNPIYRASAITLLANSVPQLTDKQIAPWVASPHPLIRFATAQVGYLLSDSDKSKSFRNLVQDEFKAIRVKAAEQLSYSSSDSETLKSVIDELMQSYEVSMWRAEGPFNKSIWQTRTNQLRPAISSLEHAIQVDPYFAPAYVNLAEIYRQVQLPDKEQAMLLQGLSNVPNSALLHYAFGMFQIRQGDKKSAVDTFKQASELDRQNSQYAYVYFIALDNIGETQAALNSLLSSLEHYQNAPQLLELGLSFARKIQDQHSLKRLYDIYQQQSQP